MCQGAVTTAACTEGMHAIGTAVWVADDKRAWVKGVVRHVQGQTVVVVTDDGQERTCSSSACLLQNTDQSSVDVSGLGCDPLQLPVVVSALS